MLGLLHQTENSLNIYVILRSSEHLWASPLGNAHFYSGVDKTRLGSELMPVVCRNRPKESLTVCRADSEKSKISPMSMIRSFARLERGFSPRLSPRQRRSKISLSQSEKSRLCTYHQSAVASRLPVTSSPTSDGVSETFPFPSQRAAQKGLTWQHLSTPACSSTELCKHLENNSACSISCYSKCCEATVILIDLIKTFFFFLFEN